MLSAGRRLRCVGRGQLGLDLDGGFQDLFEVVGVVGIGADVGVDGCFFEAFSFVLDKFAVKAMEAAEIGLELTADILEVPKETDLIID